MIIVGFLAILIVAVVLYAIITLARVLERGDLSEVCHRGHHKACMLPGCDCRCHSATPEEKRG